MPETDLAYIGWDEIANELFHVVVDGASLLDGRDDRWEVVVGEDHLRGGLGDSRARAHRDADLGFLQRRRVVHSVAGLKRYHTTIDKLTAGLCGGYNYDLTSIRRPFDCLSKVTRFTVTWPASRSHADLFTYLGRSAAARSWRRSSNGRSAVELQSNGSRTTVQGES